MKKKIWLIIVVALLVVTCGVIALLRFTGGSRTSIDNTPEPDVSGTSKVLVAYFSWSGNGQQLAHWIAEETGGDLFRILTEEPYGEDFDSTAERAQTELNDGARPALSVHIDPKVMAQYDTIYLGFPVWWYDLPTPVWTFLEEYDLSGKTIIPFFSHNGSSDGANSLNRITELANGASVRVEDAFSIRGNRVSGAEKQVKEWAASQNSRT